MSEEIQKLLSLRKKVRESCYEILQKAVDARNVTAQDEKNIENHTYVLEKIDEKIKKMDLSMFDAFLFFLDSKLMKEEMEEFNEKNNIHRSLIKNAFK